MSTLRHLAWEILRSGSDQPLREVDAAAAAWELDPRDRGLLRRIIGTEVRRRATLRAIVQRFTHGTPKAPLAAHLRIGLAQLLFLDKVPPHAAISETVSATRDTLGLSKGRIVNGVPREVQRQLELADPAILAATCRVASSTSGSPCSVIHRRTRPSGPRTPSTCRATSSSAGRGATGSRPRRTSDAGSSRNPRSRSTAPTRRTPWPWRGSAGRRDRAAAGACPRTGRASSSSSRASPRAGCTCRARQRCVPPRSPRPERGPAPSTSARRQGARRPARRGRRERRRGRPLGPTSRPHARGARAAGSHRASAPRRLRGRGRSRARGDLRRRACRRSVLEHGRSRGATRRAVAAGSGQPSRAG